MNQIEKIEIGYSDRKLKGVRFFYFAFLGMGIVLLFQSESRLIGFSNIVISSGLIFHNWCMSIDSRSQIIIDRTGICDPRLKTGTIFWSDIKDASIHRRKGGCFICLKLRNLNSYKRQSIFSNDICVNLTNLDADSQAILKLIHRQIKSN